jgi:hypothetical protein
VSPESTQPEPTLEELFRWRRLDREAMAWWHWPLLLLYAPFGVALVASRVVACLLVSFLMPARWRGRSMLWAAGIIPRTDAPSDIPPRGVVLASNHTIYMDPYAIRAGVVHEGSLASLAWHKIGVIGRYATRPTIDVYPPGQNSTLRERTLDSLQRDNVLIFPEGAVADGRTGILRFQPFAFSLDAPVCLVALRYRRPIHFLAPLAIRRNLFIELLVDLFQPWMTVECTSLGVHQRPADQDPAAFAAWAQQRVAEALELVPTSHSRTDRHRLMQTRGLL